MSEPIVITRDKVKRGWSDLEPKIAIALVAGFLAIVALIVAHQLGITLPDQVAQVIPLSFALLCGYLTPSSGTVVTRRTEGAVTTEAHSAPTVTTVTAPTAVQQTPVQQMAVQAPRRGSFTEVIAPSPVAESTPVSDPDSTPTVAYGSGPSILEQLRAQSQNDSH